MPKHVEGDFVHLLCIYCSAYKPSLWTKGMFKFVLFFSDFTYTIVWFVLTQYISGDQIEKNEMGKACSTYGGEERRIQGFGGETWGKEPLGRPRPRWEDNIKMDLQEVECGGMDWIEIAQDRDKWRALVNVVRTFGFHKMQGISWLAENPLLLEDSAARSKIDLKTHIMCWKRQ